MGQRCAVEGGRTGVFVMVDVVAKEDEARSYTVEEMLEQVPRGALWVEQGDLIREQRLVGLLALSFGQVLGALAGVSDLFEEVGEVGDSSFGPRLPPAADV